MNSVSRKSTHLHSWKSHHKNATFTSVLFGEAIRLRRLKKRKHYLTSLNRINGKSVGSNFFLGIRNTMIAMSSKVEERKCDTKGDSKV